MDGRLHGWKVPSFSSPARWMLSALTLAATALSADAPAEDFPTQSTSVADVALGLRGKLSGRLIDSQGRPLSSSVVLLFQNGREIARTTSDGSGRFQFTGLAAGLYQLATDGGHLTCRAWAPSTEPPSACSVVVLKRDTATAAAAIQRVSYEFASVHPRRHPCDGCECPQPGYRFPYGDNRAPDYAPADTYSGEPPSEPPGRQAPQESLEMPGATGGWPAPSESPDDRGADFGLSEQALATGGSSFAARDVNGGYIDPAPIHSRFRLRYDTMRNADFPNRAGYMYPGPFTVGGPGPAFGAIENELDLGAARK